MIGWIEPQATAIALSGLSLGSAVAALAAGLDERIDAVALYTPILGLNGMIARHLHRWGSAADVVGAAMASDIVTELTSVIDPLAVDPAPRRTDGSSSGRGMTRWRTGRARWPCTNVGAAGCTGTTAVTSVTCCLGRWKRRPSASCASCGAARDLSRCLGAFRYRRRGSGVAHRGARCHGRGCDGGADRGGQRLLVAAVSAASDRRRHRAPTLIVKLPAQSEARGAMELLGGYRRELAFYSEVAGRAPMAPAGVCRPDRGELRRLRAAPRGPGDWDNADHLAGLSVERAELAVAALAGLHRWSLQPSNSAVLQSFPALDIPAVPICWCPPSGRAGRSTASTPAQRCRVGSPVSPSGSPNTPVGAGGPDRTFDAAARRYPGRQHVLRRRPAQGCRLPVRLPRGRCQRHRLPRQPGPAVETRRGRDEELVRHYLDRLGVRTIRSTKHGGTIGSPSPT